jgi:lipoate-protein ligase A
MTFQYIVSGGTDPYANLAFEELLMDIVATDTYLLHLWQNDNTIVIGRNQNAYDELKVDEFKQAGGKPARRLSGGGAVYHDLGNLNFTLMACNDIFDNRKHYDIILQAVRKLGVNAEFNGRNDLTVNGSKFSGNAFYDNGKSSFQHGTILVNSDINRMQQYLTPDESKLQRNSVNSVSSRVVNLSELLPEITVEKVRYELIRAVNGVPMLSIPDKRKLDERTKFYASEDWILRGIGA